MNYQSVSITRNIQLMCFAVLLILYPSPASVGAQQQGIGSFQMRPFHTRGACLDVAGGSTENGSPLIQFVCSTNNRNQLFGFFPIRDGYGFITAAHSGKCVTVKDASNRDGADIVQEDCDSNRDEQLFKFTKVKKEDFFGTLFPSAVRAKHSDKCLDVFNAETVINARVIQFACGNLPNNRLFVTDGSI